MTVITTKVRLILITAIIVTGVALTMQHGEAHKAITSKYTYNDDVFPIFRDRCSRCHVTGGVAPMSLMTYDEAFPWAESIRAELVSAHMPPWNADDGFGDLKRAHTLSPNELDVILTWATGGNPRGALDQKLPEVALKNEWTMGAPDVALRMPAEFTVAADRMEDTQEVTLATGTTEARWVLGCFTDGRSLTRRPRKPFGQVCSCRRTICIHTSVRPSNCRISRRSCSGRPSTSKL